MNIMESLLGNISVLTMYKRKEKILINIPPKKVLDRFAKALHRLANEKPFEKITTRAIVEESGFSSRTFYNHFRSKYDLALWSYAAQDYEYLCQITLEAESSTFSELLLRGLKRLDADRRLFYDAFCKWHGPESLYETFILHACWATEKYICLMHQITTVPDTIKQLIRFYFAGVAHELSLWLSAADPIHIVELRDLLLEALPEPLHVLLLTQSKKKKK